MICSKRTNFWLVVAVVFVICFACSFNLLSIDNTSRYAFAEAVDKPEYGTLNYSDGSVYEGEILPNEVRSGTGSLTWSTGESYTGSWNTDKISGEGELVLPGLGIYKGAFENGKRVGGGTFTWTYEEYPESGQPLSYEGLWENDTIGSYGKLTFADLGTYEGQFVNRVRHGDGTFAWENGDVYTGKWRNDAISGEGTLSLADGTLIEGQFYNGKLNKGTVTYPVNGGTAVRSVVEARVQSSVTVTYNDGTVITGKLSNQEFTGKVTVNYPSGDTYVGTLKFGVKDGEGTYTWKSGAHYTGEWYNDKMSGTGKYYYTSDESHTYLRGTFVDGVPEGTLTYVSDKKITYETTWQNGKCLTIVYKKK